MMVPSLPILAQVRAPAARFYHRLVNCGGWVMSSLVPSGYLLETEEPEGRARGVRGADHRLHSPVPARILSSFPRACR